jgi:glutathione synthase/RimK-type ligase-like ATP-grasp enzyme
VTGQPDVLLASGAEFLDRLEDEDLLVDALSARGITSAPAVWTEPGVDWSSARMVVVRYAFDYTQDRSRFLDWAEGVEAATPLHNPAGVLRWNSHKAYLRELEADGVPIVPTAWLEAGTTADIEDLMDDRGWEDVVVKPAVDNGARGALRVTREDTAAGQKHVGQILEDRDVMIQPFVAATETVGERALIHFDGRFSHAIRKDQMLAGRPFSFERTPPVAPGDDELALAERVLRRFDPPLLYARVDTIVSDGVAMLMELEALEPVLFFGKAPGSAQRMADAIAARL